MSGRGVVLSRSLLVWAVRSRPDFLISLTGYPRGKRVLVSIFTILSARRLLNAFSNSVVQPPVFKQPLDLFIESNASLLELVGVGSNDMPFYEHARNVSGRDDWELFAICLAAREQYDYLCVGEPDQELAEASGFTVVCRQVDVP